MFSFLIPGARRHWDRLQSSPWHTELRNQWLSYPQSFLSLITDFSAVIRITRIDAIKQNNTLACIEIANLLWQEQSKGAEQWEDGGWSGLLAQLRSRFAGQQKLMRLRKGLAFWSPLLHFIVAASSMGVTVRSHRFGAVALHRKAREESWIATPCTGLVSRV